MNPGVLSARSEVVGMGVLTRELFIALSDVSGEGGPKDECSKMKDLTIPIRLILLFVLITPVGVDDDLCALRTMSGHGALS